MMEARHIVVGLCALSTMVCYADRVNVSVAILSMASDRGWDAITQGWILSSFFYGYLTTQLLGGVLAQKFGGKRLLNFAVAWWSAFTYLTPAAAKHSLPALILARVLMGMGEGMCFPGGVTLGTVSALVLSPWIITRYGWPTVFYTFGAAGFAWCACWTFLAESEPRTAIHAVHEETDADEMKGKSVDGSLRTPESGIQRSHSYTRLGPHSALHDTPNVPWKKLLQTPAVLAIFVAHFCHNWMSYLCLAWLPTYFHSVLGVPKGSLGLTFVPYAVMTCMTAVTGILADAMHAKGVHVTQIRKSLTAGGLLGPALFLTFFSAVRSTTFGLILISCVLASATLMHAGALINHLDVAPRFAGPLMGLSNTVSSIPGMVAVPLSAYIMQHTHSWQAVFALASMIDVAGCIFYVQHGTAERLFS
eukprot:jgi/Chlat1/1444/Chrsp12S02001